MKILIDIRLLSRGGTSGVEEYTLNLLRTLLAIDSENEYVFFYNGFRKKPLDLNFQNTKIVDWKIPNKLLDLSTRFLSFPAIDKFIKTDVIFSPHFNILRAAKTPRVITFHDLSFLHHSYFFSWKQKFWHWLQNCRKQAERAEKIIAVSEFTRSDLINLFNLPPEKIVTIYSGIGDKFRKLPPEDEGLQNFRKRHKLDFPFLLYLGTLEPRKNVQAIVRAFNILKANGGYKNLKLTLAGRPGWLYQHILAEIKKSPFQNDIILWGQVKSEDRVFLYNLAEVFVYSSFFEGFGFPPLEAQACGCPAVTADRTSLSEIMGESAILIDPWRVDNLAEAIKMVIEDNNSRTKLIKAGLENVKKFSWEKAAKKTLEVLKCGK